MGDIDNREKQQAKKFDDVAWDDIGRYHQEHKGSKPWHDKYEEWKFPADHMASAVLQSSTNDGSHQVRMSDDDKLTMRQYLTQGVHTWDKDESGKLSYKDELNQNIDSLAIATSRMLFDHKHYEINADGRLKDDGNNLSAEFEYLKHSDIIRTKCPEHLDASNPYAKHDASATKRLNETEKQIADAVATGNKPETAKRLQLLMNELGIDYKAVNKAMDQINDILRAKHSGKRVDISSILDGVEYSFGTYDVIGNLSIPLTSDK